MPNSLHLQPSQSFATLEAQSLRFSQDLADAQAAYIQAYRGQLHRYPEEEYMELFSALSHHTQWPSDGLMFARTTPEALEYVIEALVAPGDIVLTDPGFVYAGVTDAQVAARGGNTLPLSQLASVSHDPGQVKLVCLATETSLPTILEQLPGVAVIIFNPAALTPHPQVIQCFEWREPLVTSNPLPPVIAFCRDYGFITTVRKLIEPFHIPTHLLILMKQNLAGLHLPSLDISSEVTPSDIAIKGVLPQMAAIKPYIPGKGIKTMARELNRPIDGFCKLASNEHPHGIDNRVIEALVHALGDSHALEPVTYADWSARLKRNILNALETDLSRKLDIAPDQILLGDGSSDMIKAVAKAVVPIGGKVLLPQLPFAMYPFEALKRMADCQTVSLDEHYQLRLDAMVEAIRSQNPHLVFLANPRNPLGTGITNMDAVINTLSPEQVLIIDEAYYEFIREEMGVGTYPEAIELMLNHPDKAIVVLRTFSKTYGLSSFRVGYAVAGPLLAERIRKVLLPCTVDPLSLLAASVTLETEGVRHQVQATAQFVMAEKERLYELFETLGLRYVRSLSNFVFFETGESQTSQSLFDALASQGVIIRPIQERSARVSIGASGENAAFIKAMKQVYARP
jgi:histidinol-phosphate aminotransferase